MDPDLADGLAWRTPSHSRDADDASLIPHIARDGDFIYISEGEPDEKTAMVEFTVRQMRALARSMKAGEFDDMF